MSSTPNQLARNLEQTNSRLSFWLNRLIPPAGERPAEMVVVSPEQMAGLLSELRRAGELLKTLPAQKEEALAQAVAEYRRHIERLRDVLPSIHTALLRERARLEQERARVDAAAQWARSSRQTL